ncbi:hypothetical protein PX554_14605 [Sphingomonas sp. H39-1-10]|uniref:FitA-like ribbon-helix-helix domain-containing protein n=1 Tax=Sphingomonas TaxID=13687 RepID=UPI000B80E22B|nr:MULTISPECIES: hypothetical protein [Sphingomonas]MDF0489365.1 hypothetical protein [Sphingomonas pollutisoli]
MGQVLIRNLDDGLLEDFRRAAKDGGRSLEAELRDALQRSRPARKRLSKEELVALSHRMRASTPPGVGSIDSTDIIREARDSGYGRSG